MVGPNGEEGKRGRRARPGLVGRLRVHTSLQEKVEADDEHCQGSGDSHDGGHEQSRADAARRRDPSHRSE